MNKLFLIFNHKLTEEQQNDIFSNLKVSEVINLPPELSNFWSNIPPDIDLNHEIFTELEDFLLQNKDPKVNNYCLIQGDFGATVYMVYWCYKNGFIPIYATTKRVSKEIRKEDGTVEVIKIFKHERFRRYIFPDP
ncbi:MAG TPA: CRISPR-associated protein Csx20 [Pseudothermotoga sp.]